jgi:hypothetical protein
MVFPKGESEWRAAASRYLKGRLKGAGVTYGELARRLKKFGIPETERTITMKLSRGSFSATFLAACLAAIKAESMAVEDWRSDPHGKKAEMRQVPGPPAPESGGPTPVPPDPTDQA